VEPTKENALKFERFVFDVLPRRTAGQSWRPRKKNSSRSKTPPARLPRDRQASPVRPGRRLAGTRRVKVPRGPMAMRHAVEISPLYALDAEELAPKVDRSLRVENGLYLH